MADTTWLTDRQQPAPVYRYLLCDLLTNKPLATLPLSGVSFDRRISRTGSFAGTLQAPTAQLVQLVRVCKAYAGRSALYVQRDQSLWWGGILWTVKASQDSRGAIQADLQAATFDSYAARRRLPTDAVYLQADQGFIIPDLWRRIQVRAAGNIGVEAPDQPTGTLRDRTYLASDTPYVGKLIEDLGDVEGGPEHTVDVFLDSAGVVTKRLRVANRLGRAEPSAVFTRARYAGGRVASWEETADTVDGGTTFLVRGESQDTGTEGEQAPLLSQVVERTDLLAQGWPLLDVVEDHSDVTDLATLNGYAQALADTNGGALLDSAYTVQVGTSGWSPNRLGDSVRLKLSDLWHQPTVDKVVRPVACKVTPQGRDAAEQVDLIFSDGDA